MTAGDTAHSDPGPYKQQTLWESSTWEFPLWEAPQWEPIPVQPRPQLPVWRRGARAVLAAQVLTLLGLAAAMVLGSGHIRGLSDAGAVSQQQAKPFWAVGILSEDATPTPEAVIPSAQGSPTVGSTATARVIATEVGIPSPTHAAPPTHVATATHAPSATPPATATPSPTDDPSFVVGAPSATPGAPGATQPPAPTVVYPIGPAPVRLVISSIGVDIPVITVGTVKQTSGGQTYEVWDTVPDAAAYHKTSAPPGYVGNTVMNGHRDILGSVFADLDKVQIGDPITVFTDEHEFTYTVSEILVVPEKHATAAQRAENQRLIGYIPEERLTLVTCTPYGTNLNRLLIIAKPAGQPQT